MNELTGICINAGSGQRPFKPPFVNVDAQSRFNPDICLDLRDPWPWEDASARCIVFHHCWEHEGTETRLHFQAEAFRVLKPGGSLIICVPDMRALAQAWLMGKEYMDTNNYMTNVYGAYMGDEHDRHRWGFTEQSLTRELGTTWSQVKPFDWRQIPGADIARDDRWILGIEAIK